MVIRLVIASAVVAACQGSGSSTPPAPRTGSDAAGPGSTAIAADADAQPPAPDAAGRAEEPDAADPGKLIADLGAVSAWQAVIDRASYVARRGQRGVVYGRIGPVLLVTAPAAPAPSRTPGPPRDAGATIDAGPDAGGDAGVASPYTWLVDDTEGHGTLGIRVRLGDKLAATAKLGDRVALGGAWKLDEQRRWYWDVDSMDPLPPGAASDLTDPAPPAPTHVIANGSLAPGARTISLARDHDAVYFQVVGPPPVNDGDGWPVADELGDPVFALLTLPGERASYGGQDLRSADERWQLKRGQTYWVRIGRIRKRGPDKPVAITARTAPVRVM